MVRVWVGDMRGARIAHASLMSEFNLIHKLSMLECALLFDEQTSHKSIGTFMKFGPGFFFVVTDGGDWVTELHSLQVCLFIYQKHRAKIIITFMNYWKIHDVFKQRPQVKPFMRPCSMQHPAFNRSSRRPGVESSPCVFVSEELGKAEKFD